MVFFGELLQAPFPSYCTLLQVLLQQHVVVTNAAAQSAGGFDDMNEDPTVCPICGQPRFQQRNLHAQSCWKRLPREIKAPFKSGQTKGALLAQARTHLMNQMSTLLRVVAKDGQAQ